MPYNDIHIDVARGATVPGPTGRSVAGPKADAAREQELARILDERLTGAIHRIRARLAGVDDGTPVGGSPAGTGTRLDTVA